MYEIFDPKVDGPLHEVSRKEARLAHNWFIENIDARIEQLHKLTVLDGNPIKLDFSEDSLTHLHDWFYDRLMKEYDPKHTTESFPARGNSNEEEYASKIKEYDSKLKAPSTESFSICNDIGMYIGQVLVNNNKNLEWRFFVNGKKDIAYQRSVIMGFNVINKKYNVDFDFIICQYAFRILGHGKKENDLFRAMYKGE